MVQKGGVSGSAENDFGESAVRKVKMLAENANNISAAEVS